jgi:predicted alpha-1,6-mannanase (GH76 family)
MPLSLYLHPLLLSTLFIPNISAQSRSDAITNPTERAECALSTLDQWYNNNTGLWETTGWWNSANIMTTIGNLAKVDPKNDNVQKIARSRFAKAFCRAPAKNPQPGIEEPGSKGLAKSKRDGLEMVYDKTFNPKTYEPHTSFPQNWFDHQDTPIGNMALSILASKRGDQDAVDTCTAKPSEWLDGYYDDNLWWALAWITAYDVTKHTPYLDLAEGIFLRVSETWGTNCSKAGTDCSKADKNCIKGGIYWSMKKEYVNAIANELFMSTAAHLATRAKNKSLYVGWAQDSLNWFLGTGMINSGNTINDGLQNCTNNKGTTWSYNQGVILGALVELNRAAPNASHISLATKIAKAAITKLSDNKGIIHDTCEPNCGADGTQFKGVFMRNLVELQQMTGCDEMKAVIRKNAKSIWDNDRKECKFSVNWGGPVVGTADASTQSSAMDALVADIRVA